LSDTIAKRTEKIGHVIEWKKNGREHKGEVIGSFYHSGGGGYIALRSDGKVRRVDAYYTISERGSHEKHYTAQSSKP